jgi:hypothetical protein
MKNYILLTEINPPLCMSDYFIKLLCFRRLGTAVMLTKFRKEPIEEMRENLNVTLCTAHVFREKDK